jgi:hypothetical protein
MLAEMPGLNPGLDQHRLQPVRERIEQGHHGCLEAARIQAAGQRYSHPLGASALQGCQDFQNPDLHFSNLAVRPGRPHSVMISATISQLGL